jgi:hypothetical protein
MDSDSAEMTTAMDRDRWTRLIEQAATALLSLIHQADFARIFGGLVSVYVGYKLFFLGATAPPPSVVPATVGLFTSGVVPGLLLIGFGVLVIPGKLEHVFNQYVLVIFAGITSIVLGFLLFRTGIVEAGDTELKLENAAYKLILSGQAPGLFFMFFGAAILIIYLWTIRPQAEIAAARAEEARFNLQQQSEMMKQMLSAFGLGTPSAMPDPPAQRQELPPEGLGSGTEGPPRGHEPAA